MYNSLYFSMDYYALSFISKLTLIRFTKIIVAASLSFKTFLKMLLIAANYK